MCACWAAEHSGPFTGHKACTLPACPHCAYYLALICCTQALVAELEGPGRLPTLLTLPIAAQVEFTDDEEEGPAEVGGQVCVANRPFAVQKTCLLPACCHNLSIAAQLVLGTHACISSHAALFYFCSCSHLLARLWILRSST